MISNTTSRFRTRLKYCFASLADDMIAEAADQDIAMLVVGDPLGATTHTDLILRCKARNVKVEVIHNASILSSVGCTGLQLYNFGDTVSIPFWTDRWQPESFFDRIIENKKRGLHTLCLLDIKIKEINYDYFVSK